MNNRTLTLGILLAMLAIFASTSDAQHSLQVDDGTGIGIITATGLPAGITSFSLPASGGMLITNASLNTTAWLLTGNSGTTAGTNFVGTTDNVALYLQVKNGVTINNSLILNTNGSLQRDNAGNARGQYAVDLQMRRTVAIEVASGHYSTIGGGSDNIASGFYSTIGGGGVNTTSGNHSTVGGGYANNASSLHSTIGGGTNNNASVENSTIGGGRENTVNGVAATVGGGFANVVYGDYSSVPGGRGLTLGGNANGTFGFLAANLGANDMSIDVANTALFGNTNLWLANNRNQASELRFYEAYNTAGAFPNTAKWVAFKSPATLTATQTYTLPLDYPTIAGQVLSSTAGGVLSWAAAGGGLVNFTESVNIAAPNATVPVVRLLATNAATDVDVALSPKGTGALTAQVADNLPSGGNKRGVYAVDWQMVRSANTQVSSGNYATVGGGISNTASTGGYATVGGGSSNTASSLYATVGGGILNTVSGDYATVGGGRSNTASSTYATVGGGSSNTASTGGYATVGGGSSNTASSSYATVSGGILNTASGAFTTVGGGQFNAASNTYSFVPGGLYGVASNYGQMAHASGRFTIAGDAQTSTFVLRNQTTGAAATSLFLDGVSVRIAIPTNGAMTFKVTIIGKETGGALGNGNVGGWEIIGTIANNGGAALIIGANVTRTLNTPGTWGAAPTVGVNGANMDIQVNGKAATNINWVARVETVEVVF